MRSKGSRFTLGVWGLKVCSLDVAQQSATVHVWAGWSCHVMSMVSSARGVTFGGTQRRVALFRVASVALRDIQTCFVACPKSLCVATAILLGHVQTMSCSFRGRRSTLDVVQRIAVSGLCVKW